MSFWGEMLPIAWVKVADSVLNGMCVLCMSGWEYTVDDSVSEYSAAERMYHMCRRRRWVRTRQRTIPAKDTKPKVSEFYKGEEL